MEILIAKLATLAVLAIVLNSAHLLNISTTPMLQISASTDLPARLIPFLSAFAIFGYVVFSTCNIVFPFRRWRGLFAFACLFGMYGSQQYYHGSVSTGMLFVMWPLLFVSLMDTGRTEASSVKNSQLNRLWLEGAQKFALIGYGISGIWKLVTLWQAMQKGQLLDNITLGLPFAILEEAKRGGSEYMTAVAQFFHDHPALSAISFLGVVALHLMAIVAIILPRWAQATVLGLMFFHIACIWILNFTFPAAYLLLAVLFMSPRKTEYST